MVVLSAAPCRTQLRRRLLRESAPSGQRAVKAFPLRKKKREEHRQRVEAAGDREPLCRTSNASAGIPAIYLALLGRCALTRDDELLVTR